MSLSPIPLPFSSGSPVWDVCTSCMQWHERWHWHGSLCSRWCHSPWWCTGPGGDLRWLPLCLAWERWVKEIGATSRTIAAAHYYAGESRIQRKRKHPNKQLTHYAHKIVENITSLHLKLWSPALATQKERGRECGDEESCFSGIDRGLSEAIRELQGLQLSEGSAFQTKDSSRLFS